MPVRYQVIREIMQSELFTEILPGHFGYHQAGMEPWFISSAPDSEGYVDAIDLLRDILRPTPYIDVQQRLVRRIEQALNP